MGSSPHLPMWNATISTQFLTTVYTVDSRWRTSVVSGTCFTYCWRRWRCMCSHWQTSNSVLRNLELISTHWTWHIVSWQFVSAITFKTLKTERVSTRQQPRILDVFLTYRTLHCPCSHCLSQVQQNFLHWQIAVDKLTEVLFLISVILCATSFASDVVDQRRIRSADMAKNKQRSLVSKLFYEKQFSQFGNSVRNLNVHVTPVICLTSEYIKLCRTFQGKQTYMHKEHGDLSNSVCTNRVAWRSIVSPAASTLVLPVYWFRECVIKRDYVSIYLHMNPCRTSCCHSDHTNKICSPDDRHCHYILSLTGLIYATAAFRTLRFIAFLCPVFLPRNLVPYFPRQQLCSPFSCRAFSIPAILCRIVLWCIISATYGVPIYNPIMTKTAPFTEVHYHVCLFPVSCTTE